MIADLKPYPTMKDSGVPWLGEVPEHWEVRRLKQTFSRIVGGSTPSSAEPSFWDGELVWVTPADISKNSCLKDSVRRITHDGLRSCSAELVPQGSLIVTSRAPVGNVAITERDLCTNQGCKALVACSDVVNAMFGFHVLTTLKEELQSLATGTTFTEISTSRIGAVSFPLPSLSEQDAIVRFLDYVDRRIQRYIRAKKKLMKLLEEQKQAIIHRAVTRGLDPGVRLKPSGVEWLGDVPTHWDVLRSKRVFMPRTELALPGDVQLSATQAYGVISQSEYERKIGRKIVRISRHLEKRRHVEVDDFVISMRSFEGGLERAWERGCIRSSYVVLRARRKVCVPYFAKLFKSIGYIGALQSTANFIRDGQDLNYNNFCAIDLPWPPIEEQTRIAAAVNDALATSLMAGERAAQEIALLREYRTRLIADVVTGKLDVREAAARLPEEVEEAEPLDESDALVDVEDSAAAGDELEAVLEEAEA